MSPWMQALIAGWPMILANLPTFFLILALIIGAIWWIMSWRYRDLLASKDGQIELQDRQLADFREKFSGLSAEQVKAGVELIKRQQAKAFPSAEGTNFTQVRGKTFRNERVLLDGFDYEGCTFENVTLVYNGGAGRMHNNKVAGFIITSDVPEIHSAITLLFNLGLLKIPVMDDTGAVLQPSNPFPFS